MPKFTAAQFLIIGDLGMRKLSPTASEDLLEVAMRLHERASTMVTSGCPVGDCGKLLGDNLAVSVMLDRLLHHSHVLKCGSKSWRTRSGLAAAPSSHDRPALPGSSSHETPCPRRSAGRS